MFPLSIKHRRVLILLIASIQAVCLCLGMMFFSSWLRSSIQTAMESQVLADNVLVAGQMSKLIDKMNVADLRSSEQSWNELQEAVRSMVLPNDGYVCVVDAQDGSLLCHPALETHPVINASPGMNKPGMNKPGMNKPGMNKPGMNKPAMAKPGMTKPGMNRETSLTMTDEVQGMVTDYGGEVHVIAAAYMPKLNAHVKVHQKAAGIQSAVNRILKPLLPLTICVCLGLVGCTTGLIATLMRRYDYRLASINENLEELVEQRTDTVRKTRDAVVFGLAKLAESRDTDTGEHLDRIRLYVTILAGRLRQSTSKTDKEYIQNLALASSLHDIGKVGVPDQILLKPGGFTIKERKVMETHAKSGGDCLQAIGEQLGEDDFLQLAREIAYCHHEKWDGTGYPFGLVGEAIPFAARIVALADVYDALRSLRPYKQPMTHEQAKAIILDGCGSHFDPTVVDAFVACEPLFIEVSDHYNAPKPAAQQSPQPAITV